MKDGLTEQRRKFVELYMSGMTAKDAAIEAGYSPKSAQSQSSQLLKNPKVAAAIKKRQESDPLVLDRKARLQLLSRIAMGHEKEQTAIGKGDDVALVDVSPKMTDRLRALDQLNKMAGDYGDGNSVTVSIHNQLLQIYQEGLDAGDE